MQGIYIYIYILLDIETVVTCSMPDILHDSTGRIDKEKLEDFLSYKSKQVIGWFRFRHNSCLVPTLRDKLLHKQFASHFSSSHGYKEDFFITCLLSSSVSNTSGTHKFRHVLLRRRRGYVYIKFCTRLYSNSDHIIGHLNRYPWR